MTSPGGPVVWLDQRGEFTGFVDRWRAADPELPVLAWRGSFLELMLALGPHDGAADPAPLLVHMPGFTEESVELTPVYPLYKAGRRFRRALPTVVEEVAAGRVARDEVATPGGPDLV